MLCYLFLLAGRRVRVGGGGVAGTGALRRLVQRREGSDGFQYSQQGMD